MSAPMAIWPRHAVTARQAREGMPRLTERELWTAHGIGEPGGCDAGNGSHCEDADGVRLPAISPLERQQRELAQATLIAERDAREREATA